MDTSPGEWEACVDRLYESVGKEEALADAVGAFRPFFGAQRSVFLTAPSRSTHRSLHLAASDIPASMLVEYHSHYFAHDEWVKTVTARGGMRQGCVYRGSALVPFSNLRQSYFFKDYLVRYGLKDIITTIIENPSEENPASFVTFHRQSDQPLYPVSTIKLMENLAPHLGRTIRLHRRLAPQLAVGATLKDLFRCMELPMLFLGRDGTVVESNDSATKLLSSKSTLVQVITGRLFYRTGRRWAPIDPELERFTASHVESFQITSTDGEGHAAALTLRRVHAAFTDRLVDHPTVAVCTVRAVSANDPELLKLRFGLTDTEARVASLLADGNSPKQISEEMQVASSTVRTHLNALFDKVGVRRQGELVARFLKVFEGPGT